MTTAKQIPAANGAGPAVPPPNPAPAPGVAPVLDGWQHVSGPVRKKPFSVYKRRSEEPGGWLMVVDTRAVFVPDPPPDSEDMIAAVLAEVARLVAASPAASGPPGGRTPAPPPPPPRGQGASPQGQASHQAHAQQTFPGEQQWPGDRAHVSMGTPPYIGDPAMKSKFGNALAARLQRRPPTLNGWVEVRKVIGPSPPHRPGLWELFPGMGGAPHADANRMEHTAADMFKDMGYNVENGHVFVGKAGGRG